MRILTVCYEYPPLGGGGAPVCRDLCEALASEGHHVDVVTSRMKDLPELETRGGVTLHRVACRRKHRHYTTTAELLTGLWPAYAKAAALHRKAPYDINHCHYVVPSGIVSYWLWKRTGLPYIITSHGSDIPGYNPDRFKFEHHLVHPLWKRIVRASGAINTPSRFLAGLIRDHAKVPVDVIPYGFKIPTTPPVERRNRILVATRMFERKGVQYFLRALAELETDWEVSIAGDGPYLPELRQLAKDLNVNVTFHGQVPSDDLAILYRTARVFVFPSVRDNFPVVLLEAMAAGCAVVTSNTTGCAEVVGDAAITIEPESVESIRRALAALLPDAAEIHRRGLLSRERVSRFSWDHIAREHEALYVRSLNGNVGVTA